MKRLLLVRHGESEANVVRIIDCAVPGPPLSPLGRSQAEELVERLGDRPDIRVLAASTMIRAQQTIAPLAARLGLPVQVRDGLREFDIGDLHPRADVEAHRLLDELTERWLVEGDLSAGRPGGENGWEAISRFRSALVDLLAGIDDGVVVAAVHGGILRLAGPALTGSLSGAFTFANHVPNTGVVEFEPGPDGLVCTSWVGLSPR